MKTRSFQQSAMNALTKTIANVWTDGRYSDLTVVCKDREWKVHKLVVCAQSSFFSKACDGSFQEAHENKITLAEDDPEAVGAMLYYFYHFNYLDSNASEIPPILLHLRLAELGEKYFVEPLCTLATQRLRVRAYADWHTEAFADIVEHLWAADSNSVASYMETLKTTILEATRNHHDQLFKDQAYARFQEVILSSPGFLFDYAKGMTLGTGDSPSKASNPTRDLTAMTWFKCPGKECARYDAIFGIGKEVTEKHTFTCPLKCISPQKMPYWEQYKTVL